MRAVMIDEALLAERERLGLDRFDEEWDGELHMIPPPSGFHQRLNTRLAQVLGPIVEILGLEVLIDTGLFRPDAEKDYRVPDVMVSDPALLTQRGVEGPAVLVVEIRSPGDESYAKLGFYGEMGVGAVVIVHPDDRRVELFGFDAGDTVAVEADADGGIEVARLGIRLAPCEVDGEPRLRIEWAGGAAEL